MSFGLGLLVSESEFRPGVASKFRKLVSARSGCHIFSRKATFSSGCYFFVFRKVVFCYFVFCVFLMGRRMGSGKLRFCNFCLLCFSKSHFMQLYHFFLVCFFRREGEEEVSRWQEHFLHDGASGMCRALCRRGSGSNFHRRMVDTCFSTNLSRRCDFAVWLLAKLLFFWLLVVTFLEIRNSYVLLLPCNLIIFRKMGPLHGSNITILKG